MGKPSTGSTTRQRCLQFEFERLRRHHTQPQARAHRLFDGLVGAQLAAGLVRHPVRREMALHGRARARARLAQHQRLAGQLLQGNAALRRQRVARRGDHHQRVVHEMRGQHIGVVGRAAGDGQIRGVVGQRRQHDGAIGHLQADAHARMPGAELGNQLGQEVVGRGDHGQPQHAAFEPAKLVHRGIQLRHALDDVATVAAQFLAGFGQEHALADLFQQRQADLVFQLLHLHRHRGLRQMQFARGARDRAVAGHRFEDAQLAQGDVHKKSGCQAKNC